MLPIMVAENKYACRTWLNGILDLKAGVFAFNYETIFFFFDFYKFTA